MMSRRRQSPTAVISAVAAIAVWCSAALGGTRAPSSNDALTLHAVAVEAPSAPLPTARQVHAELSAPIRPAHGSPDIGLVGIDRSVAIPFAAALERATSVVPEPQHVRPRRLAFRYDATAPPAVL